MISNLRHVVGLIAMAQRADVKSRNLHLLKEQRDFHAGRREGYLKAIAVFSECTVKDIRREVLGPPEVMFSETHYIPTRADELD